MARKKAPISDLSISEKQAAPLAQRLNGLITDPNALKEHLGCSIQAINQYRLGTSRPTLENLCKIADFYNVSTDYLLGRTDIKSTDLDFKSACEYMGFTQETGKRVLEFKNCHVTAANPIIRQLGWLFNEVVSNPEFFFMMRDLSRMLIHYSEIFKNFSEEEPEGRSHFLGDSTITDKDVVEAMAARVDAHFRRMTNQLINEAETEEYGQVKKRFPYIQKSAEEIQNWITKYGGG